MTRANKGPPALSSDQLRGRIASSVGVWGELQNRYVPRLLELAEKQLNGRIRGKVDPEDVVRSALASAFAHRKCRRIEESLWGYLAAIVVNKCRGQIRRHTAGKRDLRKEVNVVDAASSDSVANCDPTPGEAACLLEIYEGFRNGLTDVERAVFDLHLQGKTTSDISVEVQRTRRTVEHVLKKLRERLSKDLQW